MLKVIGIALAILFAVGLMATIAKEKGIGTVLEFIVIGLLVTAIVRMFSPLVAFAIIVLFLLLQTGDRLVCRFWGIRLTRNLPDKKNRLVM